MTTIFELRKPLSHRASTDFPHMSREVPPKITVDVLACSNRHTSGFQLTASQTLKDIAGRVMGFPLSSNWKPSPCRSSMDFPLCFERASFDYNRFPDISRGVPTRIRSGCLRSSIGFSDMLQRIDALQNLNGRPCSTGFRCALHGQGMHPLIITQDLHTSSKGHPL